MSKLNLINLLCRVCGNEDKNCVPIFSETGVKQSIHQKMRFCLSLVIDEKDEMPKQICLMCLNKVEAAWDLNQLCKRGQLIIADRLNALKKLHTQNGEVLVSTNETEVCPICKLEVEENQKGVCCDGMCKCWHHCNCIHMSDQEYNDFIDDKSRLWFCPICKLPQEKRPQTSLASIEEKLKGLSENNSIIYGQSAVISLTKVPVSKPLPPVLVPAVVPAPSDMVVRVMPPQQQLPVTYVPSPVPQESSVTAPTTTATDQEVYPASLIQVNPSSKPVMYTQRADSTSQAAIRRKVKPKRSVPLPLPMPAPRLLSNSPSRRRALKEGEPSSSTSPKRSLQVCKYCNKSFPNDIIDHHVNLHLRQSFFTCLDCNKNFRTETGMSKHKCGGNEPIDLDADDEPIFL